MLKSIFTALGVTNAKNTDEKMTIKKMIVAQAVGGAVFSVFGGQHLVILITTAPVVIFTKIIKSISGDFEDDFLALYWLVFSGLRDNYVRSIILFFSASGLFNTLFLVIYSCTNCCYLMKFCYRSVDEVFGVFISIAFLVDAILSCIDIFNDHYCTDKTVAEDAPICGKVSHCFPYLLKQLGFDSNTTVNQILTRHIISKTM